MKRKKRVEVAVDDLTVGSRVTVLRNRTRAACGHEPGFLKGTVLHVTAISLPYLLVEAFDPLRGKANLSVDVRQHQFASVSDEYANAVIARCGNPNDEEEVHF